MSDEDFKTPTQVADKLRISTATVYNKIHSGEWECTQISDRIYRFSEDQFRAIAEGTNRKSRKTNKTRLRAALKAIA